MAVSLALTPGLEPLHRPVSTPIPAEGLTLPPLATWWSLPIYVVILIGRKERKGRMVRRGDRASRTTRLTRAVPSQEPPGRRLLWGGHFGLSAQHPSTPALDVPVLLLPGTPSKMSKRLNYSDNNRNIPFSLNTIVTVTKNIQPLMGQRWSWIHAFKGWEERDRIFLCSTVLTQQPHRAHTPCLPASPMSPGSISMPSCCW